MTKTRENLKTLQSDDIFVPVELKSVLELTGLPARRGLTKAIISNGKLVNVVSDSYGFLPNENFFLKVEEKLINEDIKYVTRSINKQDQSFAVDYILSDENFHIQVKKGEDKIKPMLRFTNSYDGSAKTSGHFGFFREICSNGLHIANTEIDFSIKHRGNMEELVLPHIKSISEKFMNNEYYSLHRKFEVLAEKQITNLEGFVKFVADKTKMFVYEKSAKNPEPSIHAREIIEIVQREAIELGVKPNLWLGYNAFNSVLHNRLKKGFNDQYRTDSRLFETVLSIN